MTYNQLWHMIVPPYDESEAKAIIRMVLEVVFNFRLADLYSGKVNELSPDKEEVLREIVARLKKCEPVQYVLRQADFCGRTFEVCPGVLIPRPETAELCEWITTRHTHSGRLRILDIGTGSGCIALTLALNLPCAQVEGWDISAEALCIAEENNERLKANVRFLQKDILAPDSAGTTTKNKEEIDIIVSNPPYICMKERGEMDRNVLNYEPETALFVPDNDPLRFYRAIAEHGKKALRTGGELYFEINPLYASELKIMLEELGYKELELREDSFGKQRMMKGVKP